MSCVQCERLFDTGCEACDTTSLKRIAGWYRTVRKKWYCGRCVRGNGWTKPSHEYQSSWFCQSCLDIAVQEKQAANDVPFETSSAGAANSSAVPLATSSAGTASSSAGIASQSRAVVPEKWPPARPMYSHSGSDLKHMKPLAWNDVVRMYGRFASNIFLRAHRNDVESTSSRVQSRPPCIIDLRWNDEHHKGGIRTSTEKHRDKHNEFRGFKAAAIEPQSEEEQQAIEGVYRYDMAEQCLALGANTTGKCHGFLGFISWNSGGPRQCLDQAAFMSKSFALGMLQEAYASDEASLEARGMIVVCGYREIGEHCDLCLFGKDTHFSNARCLGSIFDGNAESWRLKALFGEFTLKTPMNGSVNAFRLGSAHLHNDHAKRFDKATDLCSELLAKADELAIDLIGVDLNGAAHTHYKHPDEDSSFLRAMWRHLSGKTMAMSADLLALHPDDCTGFIVPVRSQLRQLFSITRHGWIPLWLPDIGLRVSDEASHVPVFCFWRLTDGGSANKRQRAPDLSDARKARKARKNASKRTSCEQHVDGQRLM